MIKKIIWFLVLPLIVGVGIYFIFFNKQTPKTPDTNTDTSTNTQTNNTNTPTDSSSGNTTTDILTGFSTSEQIVGASSTSTFNIEKITNTAKTGYHEFVFTLSSTGIDDPYVIATYRGDLGVIRINLKQIEDDNSGIGYQKTLAIGKEGISQLYHNVSSGKAEEIYEIGVSKSTAFKLTTEKIGSDWNVKIDVQYPGENTATSEFDLGSTDFSKDAQSIKGVGIDQKASILSYSYSISSNVLKFVWNVSSADINPVPQVSAGYDAEKRLVVTFDSLSSDKVLTVVNNKSLPGGLKLETTKVGDGSEYIFSGMSDILDYKLSGSISPNQVIIEIKL